MSDFQELHLIAKQKFLSTLSELLTSDSWSDEMLRVANYKCDFSDGYYHILFPEGLEQVIHHYENWLNLKMKLLFLEEQEQKKTGKIRVKLARSLEIRIIELIPKQATLNHVSHFLLPNATPKGLRYAFETCNQIWYLAGDQSTDFNYYSKRALLLPVYLLATSYYFSDESPNSKKTREFIKSSLDNIVNIANLKKFTKWPKMEDIPLIRLFL